VKSWIDLSVLRISHHAAGRYCERITGCLPTRGARSRATARIASMLRCAVPLPELPMHDGVYQQAWQIATCVVIVKNGSVVTVLTEEQYKRGIRGDEA
jgi:hypothetical protein